MKNKLLYHRKCPLIVMNSDSDHPEILKLTINCSKGIFCKIIPSSDFDLDAAPFFPNRRIIESLKENILTNHV